MTRDIRGVWVSRSPAPADLPPVSPNNKDYYPRDPDTAKVLPYVCAELLPPFEHWTCFDLAWKANTSWRENSQRHAYLDPYRVWDEFDPRVAETNDACTLDPLPSRDMVAKMVDGRTLLFVGDSINEQLWAVLGCELFGHYQIPVKLTREELGVCNDMKWADDIYLDNDTFPFYECLNMRSWQDCCNPNAQCWVSRDADARPHVRVCWVPGGYLYTSPMARSMYGAVMRFGIKRGDVVVANEAVHLNRRHVPKLLEQVAPRMEDYLRAVRLARERLGENAPYFWWRESHPQHFGGDFTGNGEFSFAWRKLPCEPNRSTFNRMGELQNPALLEAGIPIMRVWNASFSRWFEHPGQILLSDYDCTHFCLPSGALRHWSRVFWHHLWTVVSAEKEP